MADQSIPVKTCGGRNGCGETKPITEFPLHDSTGRPRSPCKKCETKRCRARVRNYSPAARTAAAARSRAWSKANPERAADIARRTRDKARLSVAKWASYVLIRRARHDAKKQGIVCTITGADVQEIYDQQAGKCALTGRKLLFGSRGRQRDSMSLDRIENGGDYTPENVRLVTYQANMARGKYPDDELLDLGYAVIATAYGVGEDLVLRMLEPLMGMAIANGLMMEAQEKGLLPEKLATRAAARAEAAE